MSALTFLSLTHVPPRASVPAPLPNADRLRVFRAVAEPVLGNAYRWQHLPAYTPQRLAARR